MVEIIGRAQWGARYAAGFGPAPLPAQEVWLHQTVTRSAGADATFAEDAATIRLLDQIGQDRFGGGISYTWLVTEAGRIFEGHGVARRGAHTKGRNTIGRAIALVGTYEIRRPSEAQLTAVPRLLRYGHQAGWWVAPALAGGHRDAPGARTSCPGEQAHHLIGEINRRAARQEEDNVVSAEFEAFVRALDRDLRGDLHRKQQQLDRIEAKLDQQLAAPTQAD